MFTTNVSEPVLKQIHYAHNKIAPITVSGVLENGIEDFHDSEDVYEAIGEVLQEIANKSESDIR